MHWDARRARRAVATRANRYAFAAEPAGRHHQVQVPAVVVVAWVIHGIGDVCGLSVAICSQRKPALWRDGRVVGCQTTEGYMATDYCLSAAQQSLMWILSHCTHIVRGW